MEILDKTGQPRSDEELQEAINCINQVMGKHPLVLPILTLHAGTIRACLVELQNLRNTLSKGRHMENLDKLIALWKSILYDKDSGLSPNILNHILATVGALEELKSLTAAQQK